MAHDTPPQVSTLALPEVTRIARGVAWLGTAGLSVGLCLGTVAFSGQLAAYVTTNTLEPQTRARLLALMASGALVGGLWALVLAWRSYERLEQYSVRVGPLTLVGLMPPLFHPEVWADRELTLLMLILVVALVLERLCLRAVAVPPLFDWRPLRRLVSAASSRQHLPASLVAGGISAFAVYFALFSINNHHALRTASFDLGIEENLLWNAAHFNWPPFRTTPLGGPMTHLGYHQTWISYLIAPVYRLWPRAEFLLVLQAVVVALAAIPLYLLTGRRLGQWWGAFFAALYLAYGPLHGSIMYDFHYQPLSNVLLLAALFCILERKTKLTVLFVVLTLMLREDMSLPLGVFAAALVLSGQQPKVGIAVGLVCALHFVVLKLTIMPRFLDGASSYLHQYQGLLPAGEDSYGGIIKTVVANPSFTFHSLLERQKLIYLLELLAPLVLLSFRRPIGWLLALPGFFFTLLATEYPALISTSFQYTTYWTVFLFVAATWALELKTAQARRAWVLPLLFAGGVCSLQFGAFVRHQHVRGGWDIHHRGLTERERGRYGQVTRLVAQVPPDESVVSSERLVPHISNRKDSFSLRNGLQGATWLFTGNSEWPSERPLLLEALRGDYGIVAREGEFIIAKRGAPKALNGPYLMEMGFGP